MWPEKHQMTKHWIMLVLCVNLLLIIFNIFRDNRSFRSALFGLFNLNVVSFGQQRIKNTETEILCNITLVIQKRKFSVISHWWKLLSHRCFCPSVENKAVRKLKECVSVCRQWHSCTSIRRLKICEFQLLENLIFSFSISDELSTWSMKFLCLQTTSSRYAPPAGLTVRCGVQGWCIVHDTQSGFAYWEPLNL